MNSRSLMAAVIAGTAALAAPAAWAQTVTPPSNSTDIPEERATNGTSPSPLSIELRDLSAQELRDKPVYDRGNEKVATIKDVTGTVGQPRTAILETGGVLGIGARDVSVPLDKLSVSNEGKVVVNMTEDELKLLPKVN